MSFPATSIWPVTPIEREKRVALNLVLIPTMGALGAAVSTAVVEFGIAVVEFFIVRTRVWG